VLRIGERAAFHGSPLDGVPAIRALLRARPDDRLSWLLGVCLGAAGRYGAAIATLTPITTATGPGPNDPGPGPNDPGPNGPGPTRSGGPPLVVASLASSTLGSLYRQLGRHAEAEPWDQHALGLLQDCPEPGAALVDARLGLAADAVGLHDLGRARAELALAVHALSGPGLDPGALPGPSSPQAWRVRARLCWVRAEVALLRGDAQQALIAAREAVRLARAARAPRHEAKGLLFASVAEAGSGRRDVAIGSALASLRLSVQLGAWPLVWPAGIVLSDLLGPGPQRAEVLALAVLAVDVISDNLPGPLADQWRQGADVQRLLHRASVQAG